MELKLAHLKKPSLDSIKIGIHNNRIRGGFPGTTFEYVCIGNDIAMLLFKGGELWGKKVVPPRDLNRLGWHKRRPYWNDRPIDETFWRYRVGTTSGDISYIFKIQKRSLGYGPQMEISNRETT